MNTQCAAERFGDHDYSQPPHNTPEDPRDAPDEAPCQAQSADMPPWCQHERRYEIIMFQIATHDWIRLFACIPCTATIRKRHMYLGPGGSQGVHRVRDASRLRPAHGRDTIPCQVGFAMPAASPEAR